MFLWWQRGKAPDLCSAAVDFDDVFGYIHELVDKALSVHLGEDTSLVVVPERYNVQINIIYIYTFRITTIKKPQ